MLPRYNSISFQVYYVFTQCNPAFLILCLPSPSIWLCYNQFSCVLSCISFVNRRNVNQLIDVHIYWFTKYTKNTPSIKDADLLYKRPLLFSLPKLSFGPSQLHGSHQQVILDSYFLYSLHAFR